jgi:hypothetical protein
MGSLPNLRLLFFLAVIGTASIAYWALWGLGFLVTHVSIIFH